MAKILTVILLVSVTMVSQPVLASAMGVSSTDLIENAKELDGQEVVFTGEVIGDIMVRGDHTWINVSDGANAVGVFAENQFMSGITLAGRYGLHGDEVEITGIFQRACPEHGGDLDIHLTGIKLLEKGYPVTYSIEPWKLPASAVLALATLILFSYMVRKRHRRQQ